MTTVPVVMADPEILCVDLLDEKFDDVTASTSYPSTKLAATVAHLQIDLETGSVDDYPVTERAQVRVTAHTGPGRRTDVKRLADDARSELLSWPGNADAAGISPAGGRSGVSTDPDTGNLMCWFLVRVNLTGRPRPS